MIVYSVRAANGVNCLRQAVGYQLGLIGALVSAGAKATMQSFWDCEFKYVTINIVDKNGKLLYRIPEFVSAEQIEVGAVTDCAQAFCMENAELKKHNRRLIEKVAAELPPILNSAQ